jgi:hypothetical protein
VAVKHSLSQCLQERGFGGPSPSPTAVVAAAAAVLLLQDAGRHPPPVQAPLVRAPP